MKRADTITLASAGVVVFLIGFLPLFAGPGYELALGAGLVVPSIVTVGAALRTLRAAPAAPSSELGRGIRLGALAAALGLVTAIAHGLRVGLCDLVGGTLLYALGPGLGAVLAGAWGAYVGDGARRFRRKRLVAVTFALAAPIGSIVANLWRFYRSPQIFAYDPFVGYFSGTLYDTVIDPGSALWTFRLGTASTLLGALVLTSGVARESTGRWAFGPMKSARSRVLGGAALIVVDLVMRLLGPQFGHWHDRDSIAGALGGRLDGEACTVLFPDTTAADDAELLLRDCEDDVRAVADRMGVSDPPRITAYFFQDAVQKKELMGAANTYVAKPWREEVYLQVGGYPHPVLGHEIAHVLAGRFGRGPFKIAGRARGLIPNPGLIEGVAVWASPRGERLSELGWARSMLDAEVLPSLESVFSLGFLSDASSRSYTVAGAAITWIESAYGRDAVRALYNGQSVVVLTGKSWRELDEPFREYLKGLDVSQEAAAYAKARFDRPAVFARHCPHEVDALRVSADECRAARRAEKALALYDEALALDPHDLSSRFGRATTELRFGDDDRAEQALATLARDESLPITWRDRAEELLADQDFMREHFEAAAERYEKIAERAFDEDRVRTLEVKALGARDPSARDAITLLLIGRHGREANPAAAAPALGIWLASTDDPLANYLVGRMWIHEGERARGGRRLMRTLELGPPTPSVHRETLRLLAVSACAERDNAGKRAVRKNLEMHPELFDGAVDGRKAALESLLARCGG